MRRPILSVLLLTGAVAGFTAGVHHVSGNHRGWHERRHEAFYDHVADVCVRAARRADADAPPSARRGP